MGAWQLHFLPSLSPAQVSSTTTTKFSSDLVLYIQVSDLCQLDILEDEAFVAQLQYGTGDPHYPWLTETRKTPLKVSSFKQ
jgi:hypothetical protein